MSDFSLSNEEANTVRYLKDAAHEYGAVFDLLSVIEEVLAAGELSEEQRRQFNLAVLALSMARVDSGPGDS